MFRFSLLVILLFFLVVHGFGQKGDYVEFKRFDAQQLGVKALSFQCWDENGTFWAVSEKGLLSHNGYSTSFHSHIPGNENSVLNDSIMRLFEEDAGLLWISYYNQPYITRLDPISNEYKHFYLPELVDEEGIFKYPIVKTERDHLGQQWILTWGAGLLLLDETSGKTSQFTFDLASDPSAEECFIKDLKQISENEYLACFFKGTSTTRWWPVKFNVQEKTVTQIDFEPYFNKIKDKAERTNLSRFIQIVNFVYIDSDENFWLSTYSGVIFVDRQKQEISRILGENNGGKIHYNLGNGRVYSIFDNELWIGTTNMGIIRIDMATKKAEKITSDPYNPTTLYDNRIVTMSKDPLGNIWVCSEEGMVSIYVPLTDHFEVHLWSTMRLEYENRSQQVIPVNQILVNQDGTVWVSSGTGLQLYNPKLKKVVKFLEMDPAGKYNFSLDNVRNFKIVGDSIYCIYAKRFGLIEQSGAGIKLLDEKIHPSGMLFRHSNPEIEPILFNNSYFEGSRFLSLNEKLNALEPIYYFEKGIWIRETFTIELPSGRWLIHEGRDKDVGRRFMIYDPIHKKHTLYSPESPAAYFPDSTVNIAFRDGDQIWIGSNHGLFKFDEYTGKSVNYNKEAGIAPDEPVKAMIKDQKGNYWIALGQELLMWNQITGKTERFGVDAGLNVGSFLPAIGQSDQYGNLYFATINGILIFNPSSVEYSDFNFKLILDHVTVNEETLDTELYADLLDGEHQFHWDDDYITFSFYTTHVFGSGQHAIKYRIKELNENWVDNRNTNQIKLFNLPHGKYTLEVKATNTFGVESPIHEIKFTVKKPYWLAAWFYILIGIVIVSGFLLYVKIRTKALQKRSELLEKTVEERTAEVVEQKKEAERQKAEAEHQKEIVEEKQKEITDSITYAKRIQDAIMPSEELIKHYLPNAFVMYRPKDIVAGDFYWMEPLTENEVIFAVADCTGHGVPGAMVSVVCNNALNRTVREFKITEPGKLLDNTRNLVVEQFDKSTSTISVEDGLAIKDGMDISICHVNRDTMKMKWAGANNPLWIVRNEELIEIKGNKQPIGKFEPSEPFLTHVIDIEEGDKFYIFSDGYADQFGGEKGKKFKSSSLKKLLLEIQNLPIKVQHNRLEEEFDNWKGDYEQLDDVCVIGFQI